MSSSINHNFHICRGVLFQNQRDFPKAVESFQRAIHYRPSLAGEYNNEIVSGILNSLSNRRKNRILLRRGERNRVVNHR